MNRKERMNDGPADQDHGVSSQPTGEDQVVWQADLNKLNEAWPDGPPIRRIEDAFTVKVDLGDKRQFDAPTHLFGDQIIILPYADEIGEPVKDADGRRIDRGDGVIATVFPPNEIGYAIKHHRLANRLLTPQMAENDLGEQIKLQDTHIELVIGVVRDKHPGVITLNNPQIYQDGRFGDAGYPMVFVKPRFPEYLAAAHRTAFRDNIRTMMAGFNAVSQFPFDYNGGDPLAAFNCAKITEHAKQMVFAIAGDESLASAAREWFNDPANMIYCAELAHVTSSAGLLVPLNARTFTPLVGAETWKRFLQMIVEHNGGGMTPFVQLNDNKLSRLVQLSLAPEDLLPVYEYAPADQRQQETSKLAFAPWTMADILDHAMQAYFPREKLGEQIAGAQARVLRAMKPGLLEMLRMDSLPPQDPRRMAVEVLFEQIVGIVGQSYENYTAFRAVLKSSLEAARKITGPRPGDESGQGYFVPPCLLHRVAQNKHGGGILGLSYVGHGLHFSMTKRVASNVG